MKAYYKARVVHDVKNGRFNVEVKSHWWSVWGFDSSFSTYTDTNLEMAKKHAKERADTLVKCMVIYEV